MANHDGKVVISTALDNSGLEKGVKNISGSLGGLKNVVAQTSEAMGAAMESGFSKPVENAKLKVASLEAEFKNISDKFQEAIAMDDDKAAEKYGVQREKAYDRLEDARKKLEIETKAAATREEKEEQKAAERTAKAKEKASKKAAQAAEKEAAASSKATKKQFNDMTKSARKFSSRLSSIVSGAMVFNLISAGLREVTQYFGSALNNSDAFRRPFSQLKGALLTAFQPIYEVITPALASFVDMLTQATWSMVSFFSSMAGKSTEEMAKNAEALYKQANAINEVGNAAKKTKGQLAGFDELNKLGDSDTTAGNSSSAPSFNVPIIDTTEVEKNLVELKRKINELNKGFQGAFVADVPKLKQNWNKLTDTWTRILNDPEVTDAFDGFTTSANTAMGSVAGAVTSVATSLSVGVVGGAEDASERLEEFNKTKLTSITGNLTNVTDQVTEISGALAEIAKVFEGDAFKGIMEFFSMLADVTVLEGLDAFTGFISDFFTLMTQPIVDNADKIKEVLDKVFTIFNMLLEPAKGLIDEFAANSTAYEDSPIHKFFEELTSFASSNLGDLLDDIIEGLDGIIKLIGGEIDFEEWFNTYVAPAFSVERWEGLLGNAQTGFDTAWGNIVKWWEETALVKWWNENIAPWFTAEKWEGLLGGVSTGFDTAWTEVQKWWDETALGGLWKSVTDFFNMDSWSTELSNLPDTFETAFTDAANAAISALNDMIELINQKLKFNIPKLELLGQEIWPAKSVTLAKVPKIPYLAQGAVLPANKPFMAVVGDQRHGTNVEAPLSTIQEAVALVMQDYAASNLAGHEATVAVLQEILEAVLGIHIGDDVIANAVNRYNTRMAVVRGGQV